MLGGVYAALFGMLAVYGVARGLTVTQISIVVGSVYLGGLVFQWPVGWLSDRMDRRRLIVGLCASGAAMALVASAAGFWGVAAAAFLLGGSVNPLYSLAIAYTNDFLRAEEMAAGSGGLLFLNGVGAVGGPLAVGWLMDRFGAGAFFLYIAALIAAIGLYGLWRMTRRAAPAREETGPFAVISPSARAVAVEAAQGTAGDRKQQKNDAAAAEAA
jgi:MFS family permease